MAGAGALMRTEAFSGVLVEAGPGGAPALFCNPLEIVTCGIPGTSMPYHDQTAYRTDRPGPVPFSFGRTVFFVSIRAFQAAKRRQNKPVSP